ncbi:MAG: hypothetical protein V1808_02910 [Candidatus Daviesbacteria bacterium]
MILVLLFLLNIIFVGALWHMDVHHNLDKYGHTETRGVFKMKPEKAYRYSQYVLLVSLFLLDILFVFAFFKEL